MRHVDWQDRFHAVTHAACTRQFEWGAHDCVTFAAACYEATCDGDAAARMRAQFQWSSQREAVVVLGRLGGLRAACELILGPGDPAWLKFSKGDLVLAHDRSGDVALAVHDGAYLLHPGTHGLVVLHLSQAIVGWKVD